MKNTMPFFAALNHNTLHEAVWSTKSYGSYHFAICVLNITEEGEEPTYYVWKDRVSTTGRYTTIWQKKNLSAVEALLEIIKLNKDAWSCTHFLLKENLLVSSNLI
jgi:hypothetical protein